MGFSTLVGFFIATKELVSYIWRKCPGVNENRIRITHIIDEDNMVNAEVKKTLT